MEAGLITWTDAQSSWIGDGGGELLLKFTDTAAAGTLTIDESVEATARILVVGGGGAGGTSADTANGAGGGGGAGGFAELLDQALPGGVYKATVGAGGAGAGSTATADGENGKPSIFAVDGGAEILYMCGGGGGGAASLGHSGGSGGGGSRAGTSNRNGGSSTNKTDYGVIGYVGGNGTATKYGAGGGGAGGAGGGGTSTSRKGGAGAASDITGESVTYAGGGSGGRSTGTSQTSGNSDVGGKGGSTTQDATAGAENTGSGGGGSGSFGPGASGGSGIVIVRISAAKYVVIDTPTAANYTWDGNVHTGVVENVSYTLTGDIFATAAGDYTVHVTPADGVKWKGGGTETRDVTWSIAKKPVEKPTVAAPLVTYTGNVQTAAVATADYTFTGDWFATNAAEYNFTASLVEPANTKWADETTADVELSWTIQPAYVEKPVAASGLVYAGTNQTALAAGAHYAFTEDSVVSTNEVGTYEYTAVLESAVNFRWADGTVDPVGGTWSIARAPNAITSLSLDGWKVGEGAIENDPKLAAAWGASTALFAYAGSTNAEESAWSSLAPTNSGVWWVRATIPGTKNWDGAVGYASFVLWDDPSDIFRDYVDIAVTGYSGSAPLTNFPLLVRISESRIPGFTYARAGSDGEGLAFLDKDGNPLAYEVDTWRNGDSFVWVRLPELPVRVSGTNTVIRMYWAVREGQVAPGSSAAKVWGDYTGVWHFNENVSSNNAASVAAADATGNGYYARPFTANAVDGRWRMESVDGPVGSGRQIENQLYTNGNRLSVTNDDLSTGDKFTFSGWVNVQGAYNPSGSVANNYLNHLFSRRTGHNDPMDAGGFAAIINRSSYADRNMKTYLVYGRGGTTVMARGSSESVALQNAGWSFFSFSYSGTLVTCFCANASGSWTVSGSIQAATDNGLPLSFGQSSSGSSGYQSLWGQIDEYRLRKDAVSAEWAAAEYANATDDGFLDFSLVVRDGLKVDYWTSEPSISPVMWNEGETPAFLMDSGELKSGSAVSNYFYSVYSPTNVYSSLDELTEAGPYRAVFVIKDDEGFEDFAYTIDLFVLGDQGTSGIAGSNGDSGRVLLMNRDTRDAAAECPIDYQGHDSTSSGNVTFWEWLAVDNTMPTTWNLQPETESVLWTKNHGRRLWHLVDCRHGNTFKSGDSTSGEGNLESGQNYLPFSTRSYNFKSRTQTASYNNRSGQVVMRNTTNACVYSSCLADGIGTVYFDAVNGWVEDAGAAYGLTVEIATNTVEGLPPTDENSMTVEDGGQTNLYANLEGCWRAVPAIAYNTETGEDEPAALTNELKITTGKSKDKFYRIRVPLDIRIPVRFRIRRATAVPSSKWSVDDAGFILVDNIIASYPAMRASLSTIGRFDETLRGRRTLGWENAFSTAFPSVADTGVRAAAQASYYTNGLLAAEATATDTFVAAAKIHYRMRYLDQRFSDWKEADLNPRDGFKSMQEIEMPRFCSDLEWWYDATLQAPYYKYVDYTGKDLGTPGYSEAISAVTNSASSGVRLESGGTDWFARVREGKSDYEGFDLIVRYGESGDVATNHMDLVSSRVWRGFAKTQSSVQGGLQFRFEGLNPQQGGWADFAFATNGFYAASDLKSLPMSTTIVPGGTNDWATAPCDAATGYVMFQIDESTKSLTVAHADYQNFNTWHDAHSADGSFVGSSTEDEKKSGASSKSREYFDDFSTWAGMYPSPYEPLWSEGFESNSRTAANGYAFNGYKPGEAFSGLTTPNGWTAGPGMWVYSRYSDATKGFGLQMKGCGEGFLQFVQSSTLAPRGLESVSFKARLAQDISFDSMSYRFSGNTLMKTDYTFFTAASMSSARNSFDGEGSVSVFAYYQPTKGCYELRATQQAELKDSGSPNNLHIELFRWSRSGNKVKATRLEHRSNLQVNRSIANKTGGIFEGYMGTDGFTYANGLLISCKTEANSTRIVVGYLSKDKPPGESMVDNDAEFAGFYFDDSSSDRLKAGSYGVTCKNCPARMLNPRHWDVAVSTPSAVNFNSEKFADLLAANIVSDGGSVASGEWAVDTSRMAALPDGGGFMATQTVQQVAVQWAPAGTVDWQTLTNVAVSGYSMSKTVTTSLYLNDDASVRFKHAGGDDDPRTDVVLDDVSFKQWRGDDFGGRESPIVGNDVYGWVTNFYYSSCWITNHALRMSAKRTLSDDICTIRMPLMDGNGSPRRGIGLGMISFEYENAQENANLILQVATNNVSDSLRLYNKSNDPLMWTTVTNFSFAGLSALERAKGVRSFYLGLHGVKGVMRLLLDPAVVDAVSTQTDPSKFGEIDVTSVFCRDEPSLDTTCWWGWNLRTTGSDGYYAEFDDGMRSYLHDVTGDASGTGLSLALNNSTLENCRKEDSVAYKEHMPFVQTPTFTSNVVGEVSFRARKFALSDTSQIAEVALYGAASGDITDDANWRELARFAVTGTVYETYTYRSEGDTYRAFRLGVTGVSGVKQSSRGQKPRYGTSPVRVMIDEVAVYEAVRPTMGFRYVYPFRTELDFATVNTNVVDAAGLPRPDEQPLAGESWTVQAEIEPRQLPDEIDLTRTPRVFFSWFVGMRPWGYANWRTEPSAHRAELPLAGGGGLVFRGSFVNSRDAIVNWDAATMAEPQRVQYSAEVVYWNVNGGVQTNTLMSSEWTRPEWYAPVDHNAEYAKSGFSAYTILDSIAPRRVWINEVNVFDGRDASFTYLAETNQFIEVALPMRQSIEGWRLEYIANDKSTNTLCTFGTEVAATKKLNETNDYVFIVAQSPKTRDARTLSPEAGEVDGTWRDFDGYGGWLDETHPVAFRIVRPSEVVEHEIVLEGTNAWAGTRYEAQFSATNFVAQLNAATAGGRFFLAGNEYSTPADFSLGVTNVPGAASVDWTKAMRKTPGRCNEGETIPVGYAIFPNGDMLMVRARVGADGYGHVLQTFGTATGTLEEVLAMTLKGDAGTNIVYTIDKWWEIKSVTTNGAAVAGAEGATGSYAFAAGAGQSNDVVVVVTARPREDLRTVWGLTEDNPYTPAVMAWLDGSSTMRGEFKGDAITSDAWFKGLFREAAVTNLDLTTRYWLDIDPTEPGWTLRAGVVSAPKPVAGYIATGDPLDPQYEMVEDFDITVRMFITNENSTAESYGTAYSPYTMRGLAPGSTSSGYSLSGTPSWTSATFKVTGDIQNGMPLRQRWVPLRRFVFTGTGTESTSFDEKHEARIRVWDPFSPDSIVTRSWAADIGCPVFYGWAIDSRGGPDTVEPLKPDSTY